LLGARFTWRRFDLNRTVESLGSQTALRGYPSGYFQGNNIWGANFEFRSRSFMILKFILMGFTAFFDAGNVWDEYGPVFPHISTGVGFRGMIPQFGKYLMAFDFGVPLTDRLPPSFVIKFGQAF
jgi:hemolysin activation/secretion protein